MKFTDGAATVITESAFARANVSASLPNGEKTKKQIMMCESGDVLKPAKCRYGNMACTLYANFI